MYGTPVWLCSISRQSPVRGGRLATSLWTPPTMAESWALLRRCVGPDGNPSRERIFRMNVTVCLHRAITAEESARLPDWFHESEPTDLAGGPVEVLWENEEGSPSTRPCHNPERIPLDARNPLLWFPGECRTCPPCLARMAHGGRIDRVVGVDPSHPDEAPDGAVGGR